MTMDEPTPTQPAPPGPQRDRSGCRAVLLVFGSLALGIGLVLLGVFLASTVAMFAPGGGEPQTIREIRSQPDVVVAVRDLARLETTSFHIERVIEMTETTRRAWGMLEARDELLLVAAADVTAGVDLSDMAPGAVEVAPDRSYVRIRLPAPRVLTVRLDNERTYVHSRATDLLARGKIDLETRARQEAESTLRKAAQDAGIVERARRNAEATVGSLIRSLGYDEVEIRWEDR